MSDIVLQEHLTISDLYHVNITTVTYDLTKSMQYQILPVQDTVNNVFVYTSRNPTPSFTYSLSSSTIIAIVQQNWYSFKLLKSLGRKNVDL